MVDTVELATRGPTLKPAYEGEANTNAFTDDEQALLARMIPASQATFATDQVYSRATHGNIARFLGSALAANRTLTLPAEEGLAGDLVFVRLRTSPGLTVTVRVEDPNDLGTYTELIVSNNWARVFAKDADSGPGNPKWWTSHLHHEHGATIGGGGGDGDAAPTQVTSGAATFTLTTAMRAHHNVEILSHQANVVFQVPSDATPGSKWYIRPQHNGCTATASGGTVNGGASARLVNEGAALVEVHSNPGAAPVVLARGNVVIPATTTGARTYVADDHGRDWVVTSGNQTMPLAGDVPAGWYVNIFREVAGDITVVGADANHTLPGPGAVTVIKMASALVAFGSGGDPTTLDAA